MLLKLREKEKFKRGKMAGKDITGTTTGISGAGETFQAFLSEVRVRKQWSIE